MECLSHVVELLTHFKKRRHREGRGPRVRVSMETVYYIVTKVFSCKKKIKGNKKEKE